MLKNRVLRTGVSYVCQIPVHQQFLFFERVERFAFTCHCISCHKIDFHVSL